MNFFNLNNKNKNAQFIFLCNLQKSLVKCLPHENIKKHKKKLFCVFITWMKKTFKRTTFVIFPTSIMVLFETHLFGPVVQWLSLLHNFINKAWNQVLHRFKSCSWNVGDLRWWGSLNERAEAATSSYSAPGNFSQYINSLLVAENQKKNRSRCLVHEFSITYINHG